MNNFTDSKTINEAYNRLKEKLGNKKTQKYFEQVDRLFDPNMNEIIEYRNNGIVVRQSNKYMFHALADMDLKNWRIAFVVDITDQF